MEPNKTRSVRELRKRPIGGTRSRQEYLDSSVTYRNAQIQPNPAVCASFHQAPARVANPFGENSVEVPPPQLPQSHGFEKKRFRLEPSRYLPQHHRKDLIVLHFTAGTSCESAYRTWQADPRRIATAYGVDPDGTIVEFFPPEAWAYHLGVKGTSHHDRRSIGIEIANAGPLQQDPKDPDQLNWWPRNWGAPYCRKHEAGRYVEASYRGILYFAAMPEIQLMATASLVHSLCNHFGIPKAANASAREGTFDPAVFATYQGVASHSNFRKDKWDVGPAFQWDYLGF